MSDTSSQIGGRSIFWDSAILFAGQIMAIPLGVLASALTVRILGAEKYGYLSVFLMVSGLFSLFIGGWSSASLIRFGREEYQKDGKINRTIWARTALFLISFIISVSVLFLAGDPITRYIGGGGGIGVLAIILLYILAQDANASFSYMLQSVKRIKLYAVTLLLSPFALICVLGVLFYLYGDNVSFISVALGLALSISVTAFAAFLLLPHRALFPIVFDKTLFKEIYFFSYPVIFGNIAFYVVNWIDMVVIKYYFSMKDVGIYQVAYNVYSMVANQMSIINTLMLPLFVSMLALNKGFLIRRYIRSIVPLFFLGGVLVVCCGASIAPLFFHYVYGETFDISGWYFSVLSIGLAFKVLVYLYSGILIAHKHVKLSIAAGIAGALLNLGGDLLFVPWLGPVGATVATSAGVLLCALLYNIFIEIKITRSPSSLRIFLLTIPVFISLVIIYFSDIFLAPLLVIASSFASGFLLAKGLRLFQKEDMALLKDISMPDFCRKLISKIYGVLSV